MGNLSSKPVPNKKNKGVKIFVMILVFSIAVGIGAIGFWAFDKFFSKEKQTSFVDSAQKYYAVFLTNDQVYFAKVDNREEKFVVLTDIYYLHLRQDLQNPKVQDDSSVSLVKMGNELHGPEDKMYINRDHILFIEPLKTSSKVVDAIYEDKNARK